MYADGDWSAYRQLTVSCKNCLLISIANRDILNLQVLNFLSCMAEIKKPGGTAEDIEKYFGCSASHLIMVILQTFALSILFG